MSALNGWAFTPTLTIASTEACSVDGRPLPHGILLHLEATGPATETSSARCMSSASAGRVPRVSAYSPDDNATGRIEAMVYAGESAGVAEPSRSAVMAPSSAVRPDQPPDADDRPTCSGCGESCRPSSQSVCPASRGFSLRAPTRTARDFPTL